MKSTTQSVSPIVPAAADPTTAAAGTAEGTGLHVTRTPDGLVRIAFVLNPKPARHIIQRLRHPMSFVDGYLVAAILLPFLILFFDSNMFFSVAGWLDAWIYYSYFRHLGEFKGFLFPNTYYGSRMSWIIPGYIVNHIFPPLLANYVLHFGVYYIGALSLYYILRRFYCRRTAFMGSLLFACYPYLWRAVGTDYVDGPGIAYYLLTLALLTRSGTTARARITLALAGASYAATIYTNVVWAVFAPACLSYYLFLKRPATARDAVSAAARFAAWFAAGALLLTFALGAANYRVDGNFWFYRPSIQYLFANANQPSPWHATTYTWVLRAKWLIYAAVTLAAALMYFVRRIVTRPRAATRVTTFFQIHFLLLLALMVLMELKGLYFLEYGYYASFLIPAIVLALASQLFDLSCEMRHGLVLLGAAVVILFICWSGFAPAAWSAVAGLNTPVLLCLAGAAILLRAAMPQNRMALIGCLAGFTVLNLYFVATTGLLADRIEHPRGAEAAFIRMTRGMDAIDRIRQHRRVLFWYSVHDPSDREFESINSFYLWGYTWMGREFPRINPVANDRIVPESVIMILASSGDAPTLLDQARSALKPRGLTVSFRSREEISYGGVQYGITAMDLEKAAAAVAP